MAKKLDFNIGNVANDNNAVITWAVKDVSDFAVNTAERISSIFLPSVVAWYENTLQLIRKPLKTTFSSENIKKWLLTLPSVWSDIAMKSVRAPVSIIDNGLNWLVNNNLERGIDLIKASTTRLVGNIISNKWQSRFAMLRWLGSLIEGAGDIVWSAIKAPTWGVGILMSKFDKFLSEGTEQTNTWVNGLRIWDDDFIPRRHYDMVTNQSSRPEAANDHAWSHKIAA